MNGFLGLQQPEEEETARSQRSTIHQLNGFLGSQKQQSRQGMNRSTTIHQLNGFLGSQKQQSRQGMNQSNEQRSTIHQLNGFLGSKQQRSTTIHQLNGFLGSQKQRSHHPVDDLIKGFHGLGLQQNREGDDDAAAAARGVGVAIGPLTEEELEKMNVKTIKPLLKVRGIKVTADKKTLIQRCLCPTEEDFHPSRRPQGGQDQQPTGLNEDTNSTAWKEYLDHLTEERVLELGLGFANYNKDKQNRINMEANRRKFRAHYCIGAKAVAALIKDLPPQNPKEFKINDLFMTLSFVKNYNSTEVHSGNWRVCTDKVKNSVKCYF